MKRFVCPLLLALALPLAASAIEWRSAREFTAPPGQALTNELWLVAENAHISGGSERGLFVQAQTLELSGPFQRDVWALADTLTFSGQAAQALRVAAKRSVQIAGRVEGNLLAFGETVQIQKTASIGEDVLVLGQEIIIEGALNNRLWALGNKFTLAGHVGGSVRVIAEDITLMPGTVIEGDLRYTAEKDLLVPEGVTLKGKLLRVPKTQLGFGLPQLSGIQTAVLQFALFLAALLVGLPFVALFPLYTTRAVTALQTQHNKCLLTGGIALALLPMLAVMAVLTWIGLPLGLLLLGAYGMLLLGAYGMLLYLAKFIVAIPLAARVLTLRGQPQRPFSALPVLILGLFLLYALANLPFVGFAVTLVVALYGMGALVLALLGGQKGLPVILRAGPRTAEEPPPLGGMQP